MFTKQKIPLFIFFGSTILLSACGSSRNIAHEKANKSEDHFSSFIQTPALQTAHVGVSIYDADAGTYLFNYQGDKYFVPASNTKIVTCYAAMKYLGDSTISFQYAENDTAFFIEPAGDPSFLHRDYSQQPAFAWLKAAGKPIYFTDKNWKSKAWGSGWSWSDYESSYMAERSPLPIYGNTIRWEQMWLANPYDDVLAATVSSDPPSDWRVNFNLDNPDGKFKVKRDLGENVYTIYEGKEDNPKVELPFVTHGLQSALPLLSDSLQKPVGFKQDFPRSLKEWKPVYGQKMDSVLRIMMHRSDNFIAEQMLLMTSYRLHGELNEHRAIDSLLHSSLLDLPQPPRWVDGSGLSRYNLFTPQDFVTILLKMTQELGMERIKKVFAVGDEGTLRGYYKSDTPYLYAKTGTLSGVVALSGFLTTQSGKNLIFSVLVNNHQATASEIRKAVETYLNSFRRDN